MKLMVKSCESNYLQPFKEARRMDMQNGNDATCVVGKIMKICC